MKVYCPSCGAAVHYSGEKPRFCSRCANPISVYAKDANTKVAPKYKFGKDIDIETDPIERVPQIKGLDIDIIKDEIPKYTLGQILESQPKKKNPEGFKEGIGLAPENNPSKEEVLAQFRKEAGSIRPKNKDA